MNTISEFVIEEIFKEIAEEHQRTGQSKLKEWLGYIPPPVA